MTDRSVSFSIKKWPKGERPREKLIHFGAESLSDAELLAILLRVGCVCFMNDGETSVLVFEQVGESRDVLHEDYYQSLEKEADL